MAVSEMHYFRSMVDSVVPNFDVPPDLVGVDTSLSFISYKVTRNIYLEAPSRIINGQQNMDYKKLLYLPFSQLIDPSLMSFFSNKLAEEFFKMGLPEDEHAAVIDKLFRVAENSSPGNLIIIYIWDVTLRYLDSSTSLEPGDLTRSFVAYRLRFETERIDRTGTGEDEMIDPTDPTLIWPEPELIPATKSSIECLERVRFDSLKASVRQMPCAVCMECLDHFSLEQGTDEQLTIIRLPCSHLFHGYCILQWLDRNHLCPVCRYAMPTVEARSQPSEPCTEHDWDVLKMSVGGVLTAATCFAVHMIEAKVKAKISDYLMYVVPLVAIYSAKFF